MSDIIPIPFNTPPIEPYFNPHYWDGHTFGQGEIQPFKPLPVVPRPAARYILDVLRQRKDLPRDSGHVALEQYVAGDTVSAVDFEPGTLFTVENESLLRLGSWLIDLSEIDWDAQLVPTRPRMGEYRYCRGDGTTYSADADYGVVVPETKHTPQSIVEVYKVNLMMNGVRATVLGGRGLRGLAPSIAIGNVQHTISPKTGAEVIRRTTQVDVIAPGEVSRSRRPSWWEALGHVLRPS